MKKLGKIVNLLFLVLYCSSSWAIQDSIQQCYAYFMYNIDDIGANYVSVQFIDSSDGGTAQILNWHWDFGDGVISGEENPHHVFYLQPYDSSIVCLTIETADSCENTYCDLITHIPQPAECNADFSYYQVNDSIIDSDSLIVGEGQVGYYFYDESIPYGEIVSWYWDFGDGTFSTEKYPFHAFDVQPDDSIIVCLTIETGDSCIDTECKVISLDTIPEPVVCNARFTYYQVYDTIIDSDTILPGNGQVGYHFNDASTPFGEILSWYWDFGDGTYSTEQYPFHIFDIQSNDSVIVCLTIETIDSCIDTECKVIMLDSIPEPEDCKANFGYYQVSDSFPDPDSLGTKYQFYDQSTPSGDIVSWYWSFGDGTYSYEQNPLHTFYMQHPDTATVCLTIQTADSCIDTYCEYIGFDVPPPPDCEAAFGYTQINDKDSTVAYYFSDYSRPSGKIVSWYWDFGDGAFSYEQNTTHTFDVQTNDSIIVCLTIETMDSCFDTKCEVIVQDTILPPEDCNASFTYHQADSLIDTTGTGGVNTYQFIDQSTPSGEIMTWYWDFGDGTYSYEQNPVHQFDITTDSLIVCLTIETMDSCIDTRCEVIVQDTILPPEDCIADFGYYQVNDSIIDADSLIVGEGQVGYYFYDESFPYGEIISWYWDFGDGTYSTEKYPFHAFDAQPYDSIIVCLTIETGVGCTDTECKAIIVDTIPEPDECKADFFYYQVIDSLVDPDSTVIGGTKYQFVDQSTPPWNIISWYWDFGDGTYSFEQNPVHQFNTIPDDSLFVCLTIETTDSCVDTHCELLVGPNPVECDAYFIAQDIDSTFSGRERYFMDKSTSSAEVIDWYWDLGDGTISYERGVYHEYEQDGIYTACLTIFTADSCTSTYCDTIVIESNIDYFSISGNIYGGEELFPNGIVILYKDQDEYFMPVDANVFRNGEYEFEKVEQGDYILYAIPNIFLRSRYLPTYFVNKLFWFRADLIAVDGNLNDVDIHLVKGWDFFGGHGRIQGKVNIADDIKNSDKIAIYNINSAFSTDKSAVSIPVILSSEDGKIVTSTLTDKDGNFTFDNLYYGKYMVAPEIPNLKSIQEYSIDLNPDNPTTTNLEFTLDVEHLTIIPNNVIDNSKPEIRYDQYSNEIIITTNMKKSIQTKVEVLNYMGQVVLSKAVDLPTGPNEIRLPFNASDHTIYIVRMAISHDKNYNYKFKK